MIAGNTSSLLLAQDYFKVRGLPEIEEVLGVTAPELVLTTVILDTLATCRHLVPLAVEGLLDGAGKLNQIDWL